jgi:hypothetical protein
MRVTGVTVVFFMLAAAAPAADVNWSTDTFNHPGFGNFVGWQAGRNFGTTIDSGITVAIDRDFGLVGALTLPAPQDMQVVSVGAFGNALQLSQQGDVDTSLLGGPLNVGRLSLSFSTGVVLNPLSIFDVDNGGSLLTAWQDFVAVRAFRNGSAVGVNYGFGSNINSFTQDYLLGPDLVGGRGTGGSINPDDPSGILGVSFAGDVDRIEIWFTQPGLIGLTGAAHNVQIGNLSFSPVPEPSTFALVGIVALAAGARQCSRRRSATAA